jgi:Peptidase A4 family
MIVVLASLAATGATGSASAAPERFAPRAALEPTVSTNWAGYAIAVPAAVGVATASFTDVTGTWVQPRIKCVPGEVGAAAFWVGLGGWQESSQALEQVGTEGDCDSHGRISYSAWYELVPAGPVTVKLKVGPKDKINAAVLVSGGQVVFSLKNLTRHTRFTKRLTPPSAIDTGSAEWIAEAPSICTASGACTVVPLTNFGTMSFTKAAAIGNAHPGTISDPTWSPSQVVLAPDPGAQSSFVANTHGAVPSSASADGTSFSVTWRRSLSVAGG